MCRYLMKSDDECDISIKLTCYYQCLTKYLSRFYFCNLVYLIIQRHIIIRYTHKFSYLYIFKKKKKVHEIDWFYFYRDVVRRCDETLSLCNLFICWMLTYYKFMICVPIYESQLLYVRKNSKLKVINHFKWKTFCTLCQKCVLTLFITFEYLSYGVK